MAPTPRKRKPSATPRAQPDPTPKPSGRYNASDIQVLEGLEAVRRRPGMYIGGVDNRGLHHLVWEILDNAIDEVMNGFATTVEVTLSHDRRTVTITDNGRGIPIDKHPKLKKPALEVIMTTLHAGGKFDQGAYKHSGGLHGVGSSVVNALSVSLVATIKRDGGRHRQSYERGVPTGKLKRIGPCRGTGTTIAFTPDPEIFPSTTLSAATIVRSLEDRAYLHSGLRIIWRDEAADVKREIHHPDGIRAYLARLVADAQVRTIVDAVFYAERAEPLQFECTIGWTDSSDERFVSYVNGIRTPQGGSHESALKQAITKAIKGYLDTHEVKIPKGVKLSTEDIREGIFGIVSVFMADPQFQGQTKDRLNAPQIVAPLDQGIRPALEGFLNENQSVAEAVVERVFTAARARMASRQAIDRVRRASPVNRRLNLPGKLTDCSSTRPEESELFIVEGDSAGGTAKQGRNRRTQAILPLRGKVLNAEQATPKKLAANKELDNIILALGCGMGRGMNLRRLRYHKIILLMDADADGHHIATLLMTFFYRCMPELVSHGYLYLAQPPLYKATYKKKVTWLANDAELKRFLVRIKGKPDIQRFKGLGEMSSKALALTTLDPETRQILRVKPLDPLEADRTIKALMGKNPEPRYELIMERAAEAGDLDV